MTFPPRPSEAARTSDAVNITIDDARQAVDARRYDEAITMATGLGAAAQKSIERQIADDIARRALSAMRDGRRRRASELLASAARYPETALTGRATASFRAAQARAAARAEARSAAAEAERPAGDADREARPEQGPQPQADAPSEPDAPPPPAEPAWSSGGAAPRPLTP